MLSGGSAGRLRSRGGSGSAPQTSFEFHAYHTGDIIAMAEGDFFLESAAGARLITLAAATRVGVIVVYGELDGEYAREGVMLHVGKL